MGNCCCPDFDDILLGLVIALVLAVMFFVVCNPYLRGELLSLIVIELFYSTLFSAIMLPSPLYYCICAFGCLLVKAIADKLNVLEMN